MKLVQVALVRGSAHINSVIFGSALVPILLSRKANLSFTDVIDALVKAFSTRRIHISILTVSKAGSSGLRVNAVTSRTWSRMTSLTASGSEAPTVATEAETAAEVEARRVSWTRALMASASMVDAGKSKDDADRVGEGLGVLAAILSRRRCCGVMLLLSVGVLTRRLYGF